MQNVSNCLLNLKSLNLKSNIFIKLKGYKMMHFNMFFKIRRQITDKDFENNLADFN